MHSRNGRHRSANVWAVIEDEVVTPPAPVRCLPGIMRSWLILHLAEMGRVAREHDLTLSDLLRADEVWISNALVGVRRVRSVAGRRWHEWPCYGRLAELGLPAPSWPERARRPGRR